MGKSYGITALQLDEMILEDMKQYLQHEFGDVPAFMSNTDERPIYQTIRMAMSYCRVTVSKDVEDATKYRMLMKLLGSEPWKQ